MPAPATLAAFALSTLVLLLVPGPSVLFVVARTVEHGRTAGLISMLGLETGALIHVAVGVAGLSALAATAPAALAVLRYAGGGYLLWLGVRALRGRGAEPATAVAPLPRAKLFRQGMLVDLLNPKTALFFLAFLPGFVHVGHGPVALQMAVLGICFVALATLTDGAYALAAARLSRNARGGRGLARASAGAYGALGALALAG